MNRNGFVVWEGESELNGSPIVAILTGLETPSQNDKTQDMLQLFIIRSDMSPVEAIMQGLDDAICGDCRHRGDLVDGSFVNRSCYVDVAKSVRSVYECYKRGNYPKTLRADWRDRMEAKGRKVALRFGAYGDPAALPEAVISDLYMTINPETSTGYTHQWRQAGATVRNHCMASVDTEMEYWEAKALGFRTFRVRDESEPKLAMEAVCPAADESKPAQNGIKVSCATCGLCDGLEAGKVCDAVIMVHGAKASNFSKQLTA
jgi:hypothetical protein